MLSKPLGNVAFKRLLNRLLKSLRFNPYNITAHSQQWYRMDEKQC